MDERFRPVTEEMQRQVDEGLRPSIQGCVSWRGETVLDHAVGADATPDSVYVLWSTTKPFVAVALLQLIDEGRAQLDDRVATHIPEFACGGKEPCTIAHLLTHRGGFPDNSPERRRPLQPLLRDWDAAVAHVCRMEAVWEPGTERGYHPASGWFIVGELVQRLDGRPLAESLRARVLEPAGIGPEGFSLGTPDELASKPMTVHTSGARGAPPEAEARYWNDPETHGAVIPGAGGIARASDVVRFYRALLDERLLSAGMLRTATFPHAVGNVCRTFLRDIPWGLGFHLKHVVPSLDDCGDSATPGTFGHAGHFLVNTAWADRGKDLVCCFLSNGLAPSREGVAAVQRLSQAVHDVVDGIS